MTYEFGGPIGTFGMMFFLPITVYFLYFSCTGGEKCISLYPLDYPPFPEITFDKLYSNTALVVVCGWILVQAFFYQFWPAYIVQGTKLSTGKTLPYRINGLIVFFISVFGCAFLHYFGAIKLGYIFEEYVQLATASFIVSITLSFYLYLSSFYGTDCAGEPKLLAEHGNTDSAIYNFFMGRELNPRIGKYFDLKVFCELRPGLIGWVIINMGMALAQYEKLGYVSYSMILVNLFQGYYVLDSLISEACILTTMDITTDGFGFMLAFGDLSWVPFTYTLQARYIVEFEPELSLAMAVCIFLLNCLGYYIFRGANSQKDTFRTKPNDPSVKGLSYIKTERGSRLLTAGWWGIARHINYFGDMIMGLAWCLPCGFKHAVPYFYAIYFTILLIHRDLRDDAKCSAKYGKDWEKYKKLVKYRIIPYVY